MSVLRRRTKRLEKEWNEHGIAKYVGAICGQEAGSKTESLTLAKAKGYAPEKILMMGDAPGDMKAAQAVGAFFFPINPGHEEASWENFLAEGYERFLNGTFSGDYQDSLIKKFNTFLPELPPWK